MRDERKEKRKSEEFDLPAFYRRQTSSCEQEERGRAVDRTGLRIVLLW